MAAPGVDFFILARLEAAGLEPARPANRETWIRRVTFDLTGLPPSPEEIAEFLRDDSPGAYERVVDRLLASPREGEHWARVWLDVARYAEDQAHIVGSDKSLFYPNAWMYRDWVVRAFNGDMPYDRFVALQLAADFIEPQSDGSGNNPVPEDLVALGFLGLGPKYYDRGNPEVMADEWEDRIDVVMRGLMGLTVACARCHDHKYDPISTEDYYALAGVFASTRMYNRPLDEARKTKKDGQAESPSDAMHIVREGEPHNLHVFIRGDVNQKGPEVERRFLSKFSRDGAGPFEKGSGRFELAQRIVDPANPLTARVIVNRVWGAWFGRPLVATPSNFGTLGERPTHPELLDDLAVRFIEHGWSLHWLHREIALSATYRQSSIGSDLAQAIDPSNQLLSRMPRRRLEVEAWRDGVLAVAGALDLRLGGPSFDVSDPASRRRTLYGEVSRFRLEPMLALFDFPDPNVHAARRVHTTTPLQKLFVLNGPFLARAGELFAKRILADVDASRGAEARIRRAWTLAFGRSPEPEELRLALEFLASGENGEMTEAKRWEAFAHGLIAANELLFVD